MSEALTRVFAFAYAIGAITTAGVLARHGAPPLLRSAVKPADRGAPWLPVVIVRVLLVVVLGLTALAFAAIIWPVVSMLAIQRDRRAEELRRLRGDEEDEELFAEARRLRRAEADGDGPRGAPPTLPHGRA